MSKKHFFRTLLLCTFILLLLLTAGCISVTIRPDVYLTLGENGEIEQYQIDIALTNDEYSFVEGMAAVQKNRPLLDLVGEELKKKNGISFSGSIKQRGSDTILSYRASHCGTKLPGISIYSSSDSLNCNINPEKIIESFGGSSQGSIPSLNIYLTMPEAITSTNAAQNDYSGKKSEWHLSPDTFSTPVFSVCKLPSKKKSSIFGYSLSGSGADSPLLPLFNRPKSGQNTGNSNKPDPLFFNTVPQNSELNKNHGSSPLSGLFSPGQIQQESGSGKSHFQSFFNNPQSNIRNGPDQDSLLPSFSGPSSDTSNIKDIEDEIERVSVFAPEKKIKDLQSTLDQFNSLSDDQKGSFLQSHSITADDISLAKQVSELYNENDALDQSDYDLINKVIDRQMDYFDTGLSDKDRTSQYGKELGTAIDKVSGLARNAIIDDFIKNPTIITYIADEDPTVLVQDVVDTALDEYSSSIGAHMYDYVIKKGCPQLIADMGLIALYTGMEYWDKKDLIKDISTLKNLPKLVKSAKKYGKELLKNPSKVLNPNNYDSILEAKEGFNILTDHFSEYFYKKMKQNPKWYEYGKKAGF